MNALAAQLLLDGAADEPSKRLVALTLADGHLENTVDLIAAVYRQAASDARRGDVGAIEFLDTTAPGWQKLSMKHRQAHQRRLDG